MKQLRPSHLQKFIFFTILLLVPLIRSAASVPVLASTTKQQGNLIQNPGFEGNYKAWSSISEIQVASNWTPWWWDNPGHEPAYFRPEYKRASAAVFPKRVLSGDAAQQWFTFHASHLAGMYQQVFNVTPGQHYRFTIWAQVWSSLEDDPNTSVLPANPHLQIGIDPTGNWDPGSPNIVWSPEASMTSVIDQWAMLGVEATAQTSIVTVFMRTNPDFANKHNDMYWDQANLEAVGPPEPTPLPPTDTPGPPTATPPVTNTALSTSTPVPPQPSDTPLPTIEPTATATAQPTATVSATPTSLPPTDTSTPAATQTTEPSPTPQNTLVAVISPTGKPDEPIEDGQSSAAADDNQTLSLIALAGIGLLVVLLVALIFYLLRQGKTA
jgi:hypothetical protein